MLGIDKGVAANVYIMQSDMERIDGIAQDLCISRSSVFRMALSLGLPSLEKRLLYGYATPEGNIKRLKEESLRELMK